MQTFLPVADFEEQRPAAGHRPAGQAAGRDPAGAARARASRLRLGVAPGGRHVARPDAGARGLRPGHGAGLARAGVRRHHREPDRRVRTRGRRRSQAELAEAGLLPSWLGDEALHRLAPVQPAGQGSGLLPAAVHRALRPRARRPALRLARRRRRAARPTRRRASRVWVVRPRAHAELGACLAAGVVGLGTQSGIDVDATGLAPAELRALAEGALRPAAGEGPPPAVGVPRRGRGPATGSPCPSSTAPACCSAR